MEDNLVTIFVSMADRQPIRMDRRKAEVYVNRFGLDFDAWAYHHDLDPRAKEFYVYDLAVAAYKDYGEKGQS